MKQESASAGPAPSSGQTSVSSAGSGSGSGGVGGGSGGVGGVVGGPNNGAKPLKRLSMTTSSPGGSNPSEGDAHYANHMNTSHSCSELSTTKALHVSLDDTPNHMVYSKMEDILDRMQRDDGSGVPIRTVKSFMTKIPSVFTGADLVTWLLTNTDVSDAGEAIMMANRMAAHGYFFPIDDHVPVVKNDNTYYRFQTPYYWPSKSWAPENTDYAVYLCKRTMQNKTRLDLADYEAENLGRLQKMFSRKWEYIFMQAEAQHKVDKKREKNERKILDTQERAFWDVYRPPPGCVNTTELDIKKVCRMNKYSTNRWMENLR